MGPCELRVFGGTVDLEDAERAEDEHEGHQHPVEIAVGNVARHEFSRSGSSLAVWGWTSWTERVVILEQDPGCDAAHDGEPGI